MRIVSLQVENLKRLEAVEIRPDGSLVQITGKNGAGKTSVLDAIAWAIEGASHIQAEPIRKGWTKARIRLDLGELVVTRTFKAKEQGGHTTDLTVIKADGSKFTRGQEVLDGLIGALSFDPPAFMRMRAREQFETLKGLVPGVDFDALAKDRKEAFERRTDVGRRAKEFRAAADRIELPAGAPTTPPDLAAIEEKFARAADDNAKADTERGRRVLAANNIKAIRERAALIHSEAADLRARADKLDGEAVEMEATAKAHEMALEAASPLPEPIDITALREKMQAARKAGETAALARQKAEHGESARKAEDEVERLTKAIEAIDAEKERAVASAKMPIPGLGFGDEMIMLNGVPFGQASTAEQLRASLGIAGALNPTLRVIRILDGSLLDSDSLKLVADYAEANDLQVWVESVSDGQDIGFVIEEGRVRGAPRPEAEPAEVI